jgi:methyltransferase
MHPNLQHATLLRSMDLPHHFKIDGRLPYREGIATSSSAKRGGTLVDVGMRIVLLPNETIQPYTRVTIDTSAAVEPTSSTGYITNVKLANSTDPATKMGYYWGYMTRQASSLSTVITESLFPKGYDFVIGTSECGNPIEDVRSTLLPSAHFLVVFGGQASIEAAASNDPELTQVEKEGISSLFDWWVNCVPGQGRSTIRTEEARDRCLIPPQHSA